MHQTKQRYTTISTALFVVSIGFAILAFLAFSYIGLTYASEQNNVSQLAYDLYSFLRIVIIGFCSRRSPRPMAGFRPRQQGSCFRVMWFNNPIAQARGLWGGLPQRKC